MKQKLLIAIVVFFMHTALKPVTAPVYRDVRVEFVDNVSSSSTDGQGDIDAKSKAIITLVTNAIAYFKTTSLEKACHSFTWDPQWRKGELAVFVLDEIGNIFCYGDDNRVIWRNIALNDHGTTANVFENIKRAAKNGNWVNYNWNNGYQSAYVQEVKKNGETYILGSGFYPESQEYIAKQFVESAADYLINNGQVATAIEINNIAGQFVKGEVSLALYDFSGNSLANPEAYGLVGQNLRAIMDQNGVGLVNADLAIARSKQGAGWRNSKWKNTTFRSYVKRVTDPNTQKKYYITGGYYPDITREDMIGFVRRAISHLKSAGPADALSDFNDTSGDYVKGPLTIFVYDFKGKNLADGEHSNFVGKDLFDRKDIEGLEITKKIISQARKYGKGSFTYNDRNAYKMIYFEEVSTRGEKYIVGSGYYPSSKLQSVQAMVYKAQAYLEQNSAPKAFDDFSNPLTEFFRGDVCIFVYTPDGIELVSGLNKNTLWKNFYGVTDGKGRKVVADVISIALAGGGWSTYKMDGMSRKIFARSVEKIDPVTKIKDKYVIGSQYYL